MNRDVSAEAREKAVKDAGYSDEQLVEIAERKIYSAIFNAYTKDDKDAQRYLMGLSSSKTDWATF